MKSLLKLSSYLICLDPEYWISSGVQRQRPLLWSGLLLVQGFIIEEN